ncbi:5894_t:CDS:2, partial [Cetraspora pellucida]
LSYKRHIPSSIYLWTFRLLLCGTFVDSCIQSSNNSGNDIADKCSNAINTAIIITAIIYVILAITMIHYAFVIAAYAKSRKAKEENASSAQETSTHGVTEK